MNPGQTAVPDGSAPASEAAVDVHAHVVPASLLAELAAGPVAGFGAARTDRGWVVTVPGTGPTRPIGARMTDEAPHRAWLAQTGVTSQVISPWMDVQSGTMSPAEARDWARRLNDAMARTAAILGKDTRVLASVATDDGVAAAADLEEAWARPEIAGVLLNTDPPGGPALHDPTLEPFWAAAAATGVPIMLHPPTCGPSGELPTIGTRGNVHGRLIDNSIAVSELILHGLLDRHPGLTLVLVHGGGYLPYQASRLDGGYRTREAFGVELERERPSDYLSDLYYDTAALSAPAVAFLAGLVGADHVLLGSDYPFALGDPQPVRTVREAGLTPEQTGTVLHGTADKIFRRQR